MYRLVTHMFHFSVIAVLFLFLFSRVMGRTFYVFDIETIFFGLAALLLMVIFLGFSKNDVQEKDRISVWVTMFPFAILCFLLILPFVEEILLPGKKAYGFSALLSVLFGFAFSFFTRPQLKNASK